MVLGNLPALPKAFYGRGGWDETRSYYLTASPMLEGLLLFRRRPLKHHPAQRPGPCRFCWLLLEARMLRSEPFDSAAFRAPPKSGMLGACSLTCSPICAVAAPKQKQGLPRCCGAGRMGRADRHLQ